MKGPHGDNRSAGNHPVPACPQTQDLEICPPMTQGEQPNNASMLCFSPVNLLCEVCAECDFLLFFESQLLKYPYLENTSTQGQSVSNSDQISHIECKHQPEDCGF